VKVDSRRPTRCSPLRFALAHRARWSAEVLAQRAGEVASRALRAQQQRAYPLAVVATVAPIVGLLGTVVGMIEAFHVIAFTGGVGDASLLAGGISKALVNTAAGLAVALPSLAMHHFFRHRLVTSGLALEEQLERVLDEAR
jgi:biopolymer transport protein ExbB